MNMECVEEELVLTLCNLPDVVLEKIFSLLTFDEIAKKRQVCQRFNTICSKLLTEGFQNAENFHKVCLQSIMSQLPQCEAERKSHPLYQHYDTLVAIGTEITHVAEPFQKFLSFGLCCFIPGKVIDEIFKILRYMRNAQNDFYDHGLAMLKELRDISSMALEHFEENIAPLLDSKLEGLRRKENCFSRVSTLRNREMAYVPTVKEMDKGLEKPKKKVAKQTRKVKQKYTHVLDQCAQLKELKEHMDDMDRRLRILEDTANKAFEDPPKANVKQSKGLKRKCKTVNKNDHLSKENSYTEKMLDVPVKKEESD